MKILGIGNAIVDVICKVEDKYLSDNELTKITMKLVDEIEFKKLLSKESSINDCLVFKTEHEKWYKKSKKNYDHTRYNYAPHEFKELIENFSHEFELSNNLINSLKFHAKSILGRFI